MEHVLILSWSIGLIESGLVAISLCKGRLGPAFPDLIHLLSVFLHLASCVM